MTNWIKRNTVMIVYILTIISDLIFKFTNELDLGNQALNTLKVIGAIIALTLTQLQTMHTQEKDKK
jgi:uncharacterized membrane protein|tara:strand:+ start:2331 stop:2528 length:198 start_codon:yes stop_codon:yes gene_type:complete